MQTQCVGGAIYFLIHNLCDVTPNAFDLHNRLEDTLIHKKLIDSCWYDLSLHWSKFIRESSRANFINVTLYFHEKNRFIACK